MIWVYTVMFSILLIFLGVGVYLDKKNKKNPKFGKKINRNDYKYKAFAKLDGDGDGD